MSKPEPRPYVDREREAVMAFALSVALDPNSSADDVRSAQRRLSQPAVEDVVASIDDAWRLAALRAVLDPTDPAREALRAMFDPTFAPSTGIDS